MWSERFTSFLYRRRIVLFGAWLIHAFLMHYFILGFVSWDGFGHRGFPIVEILQHGGMGTSKFVNEWSLTGFTPFLELAHLPFLLVFKMRGFIIGFPLVVFPLCVAAIFAFLRELTDDNKVATFGALTYVAMPFINAQPFSAYVDFAVSGCLAFFLFSILRLRRDVRLRSVIWIILATFVFTMARVQAVFVTILLFPILAYALFCERERFRVRIAKRRELLMAVAGAAIGAIPAIGFQISRYLEFGSPTYPIQFSLLGIKADGGMTRDYFFKLAGIGGDDWGSVVKGFIDGWVWHVDWPMGGFYTSKYMAAGLLFLLAVVLLPFAIKRLTRIEWWLLGGLGFVSFLTRDFGVPRYAYTIVLGLVLVLGRELSTLCSARRWRAVYWGAIGVVLLHLLRPEVDYLQSRSNYVSPRMNVARSRSFLDSYEVPVFPQTKSPLIIIETPGANFILPLYGRRLSNEILAEVRGATIGPRCEGLQPYVALVPDVLFIDDSEFMKNCSRECGLTVSGVCRGWSLNIKR